MCKSMNPPGISSLRDPKENVTKPKLVRTDCQRCTRGLFSALVGSSNLKCLIKVEKQMKPLLSYPSRSLGLIKEPHQASLASLLFVEISAILPAKSQISEGTVLSSTGSRTSANYLLDSVKSFCWFWL